MAKLKVLIIADGPSTDADLLSLLESRCAVRVATDSEEAAILLRRESFDLVLGAPNHVVPSKHASEDRHDSERLHALNEAGRRLVQLRGGAVARMTPAERLQFLEDRIIRCAQDLLKHDHFTLHVVNERTGELDLLASMGVSPASAGRPIRVAADGEDIVGQVASTGRPRVVSDTALDPRCQRLALEDAASCLAVPLRLDDTVVGVFTFESHRRDTFNQTDREFVEIFADYIALALNTLNLLTVERHSTACEIRGAMHGEFVGPLSDIREETDALLAEFIGLAPLCKRVRRIVRTVESLESTVQDLVERPTPAIIGGLPEARDGASPLAGKRVLVADDEEFIRQTIRDVLEGSGMVVDTAADGLEAEQRIGAGRYDLVLSDIKMPHRNGYEVFAAARSRNPDIPVILITGFGYDPTHSIVRANPEGLAAVLFKPFKVNQLLEEVEGALSRAGC